MYKLKSDKGSTLMLVLITIAILVMLGTALLSMTLMNINMKQNDKRIKETVYLAESGIDQVYSYVGKTVEDGINAAIVATDAELQNVLVHLEVIKNYEDPLNPGSLLPTAHSDYYSEITTGYVTTYADLIPSPSYSLDRDKFNAYADSRYRANFRAYFNSLSTLENDLETKTYQVLSGNASSTIHIAIEDIVPFPSAPPIGSVNEFVIRKVSSEFSLDGKTNKTVQTDIVISDAVVSYPARTMEDKRSIKDNPLWQKALVANKDIDFQGSTVAVEGDVYGYGYIPSNTETASPTSFGGVMLSRRNSTNSNVTIDGSVFSRSYVQLNDTVGSANASNLTVNNGHVYANTLITQNNSSGKIRVNNGNVYTSDDIEMNGSYDEIYIGGSYYGYMDGTSPTATHDGSSAIVLNSDMSKAKLTITGNTLGASAPYNESLKGIMVGGTAYIDLASRYQTGESVSLKGNGIAYTWGFDSVAVDKIKADGKFRTDKDTSNTDEFYGIYSPAVHDTKVTNYLLDSNITTQAVGAGITIFDGSLISGVSTYKEKIAYFLAFNDEVVGSGADDTFIKKGANTSGGTNINLGSYIYTTGAQLTKNGSVNRFNYIPKNIITNFDTPSTKIKDDVLYQLNRMRYRNGDSVSGLEDVLNGEASDGPATNLNVNVVKKYTNLGHMTTLTGNYHWEQTSHNPSLTYASGTAEEIIFVGNDAGQTLHLNTGGGTDDANNIYRDVPARCEGIIVSRGDIKIYGDLEFNGPIISEGNIYTIGGSHKFSNDMSVMKDYLFDLIYGNDKLYETFEVEKYAGNAGDTLVLDNIEKNTILHESTGGGKSYNTEHNNVFDYDDWIFLEHWTVSE